MSIKEMLKALIEEGFSQCAIADRVGVTQPTICRATKGAAVRYEVGKAIEVFYEEEIKGAESVQSKDH